MKNNPLEDMYQRGVAAMAARPQAGEQDPQPTVLPKACPNCRTHSVFFNGECTKCGFSYAKPDPLLEERGGTHGSFRENARISQLLKNAMRAAPGWTKLSDVQREALEMNALKVSRILSGKSGEAQHWEDVAGYANLVIVDENQEK